VLAHDRARPKEFLAAHVVERGAGVLQHVEFIEDDLGLRQHRAHRIEIRPMHVGAHGGDRPALPSGQVLRQQRRGRGLAPVLAQADHLAVHDIGQDRPEALAFAALDLIEADMPRLAFHARAIPFRQEGFLRATRLSPVTAA